jgi:hypothetical protein
VAQDIASALVTIPLIAFIAFGVVYISSRIKP